MNKPGFNENNQMISKLPLLDAVEGAKPVDYYTYVLLHNELKDTQNRTEVVIEKLLIVYKRLEKAESTITELQEINKHNVKVIDSHANSIRRIVESLTRLWGSV